jgi:hypothetical protein
MYVSALLKFALAGVKANAMKTEKSSEQFFMLPPFQVRPEQEGRPLLHRPLQTNLGARRELWRGKRGCARKARYRKCLPPDSLGI